MPPDHPAWSDRLLSLADRGSVVDGELLAEEDVDRVAMAVLAEVAERGALMPGPAVPVTAQLDLGLPGRRLGYLVTVGPDGAKIEPGWSDDPWVRIRQDLAELLRAVYGPTGGRCDATREVFVKDEPGPSSHSADDPWQIRRNAATLAAHQLIAACGDGRWDLNELAVRFGSDKWGGHWYTPRYERHFAAYRDRRVRILEIGVGGYSSPTFGGASLRMWKHYFRRGLIYGLDIFDKSAIAEPRIEIVRGDQSDPAFLTGLADRIGPLDIVVDDGSHLSDHVISSFTALFPRLRPGGQYVIEDLQSSYWPGWNGGRTDLNDPATSTGFVKTLIDALHHQERDGAAAAAGTIEHSVTALHVYHNIAFIEKGLNSEQGGASWIPRTVDPTAWMKPPPPAG
jgi:demethylmacrocin O-methyltransferase